MEAKAKGKKKKSDNRPITNSKGARPMGKTEHVKKGAWHQEKSISRVNAVSRCLFPTVFATVNILLWLLLCYVSQEGQTVDDWIRPTW